MRIERGLRPPFVAALILALTQAVTVDAAVKLKPKGSEIDLVLIGFAVFQTSLSEELEAFFDSADQLPAEFTNRDVLNVRVDGTVRAGVKLDARVSHDRENLRDWRYRVRLQGERNAAAVGELDGAFQETSLTRYDTPFYGLEGTLGVGRLTTSGFATLRSGNYRVDRLRGSNLSGPYILSASPVLEGSERIAIEIRDRRDDERIVSSDFKRRGDDYTVDYFTGTVLFEEPIEAETFDGDPVHIVIEYQFEARSGATTDYLAGTRLELQAAAGLKLGATYVRAGGDDGSALTERGILAVDQSLTIGDRLQVTNEMAGPGGDILDQRLGAWRLGIRAKPWDKLELQGRYRRVGAEFESLPNPRLDSERDREEWQVDLSFLPVLAHRLTAGYGVKSDDLADDPAVDQTATRTMLFGWEARIHSWPVLRARFEQRETDGPASFGGGTTRSTSLSLDAEDQLGTWPILGATAIKAQYRLDREGEIADGATATHSARGRLESHPREGLETFLELRSAWVEPTDERLGSASSELLVGGRQQLASRLSAAASFRLRASGEAGAARAVGQTVLVDLRWEPSPWLRALAKYEWTLAGVPGQADAKTQNLFAQAAVMPFEGMTVSFGYKLDDRLGAGALADGSVDGEYFASLMYRRPGGLTLFARAERGRSEERLPPFEPTRSARETFLLGVSLDLSERWNVLAEVKQDRLDEAVYADRRALIFELSRTLTSLLRLGLGVELTVDDPGGSAGTARIDRQRLYLKLIGRL